METNLTSGEQVTYQGHLHWMIFTPAAVFLILGIPAPPLLLVGIFFLIIALIKRATTEMAVTNKRVITKRGLISRSTLEMNLSKVENIGVDQSILGRLLNYGKITVVGTGGTKEPFKHVQAPLAFRKAVQLQLESPVSAASVPGSQLTA